MFFGCYVVGFFSDLGDVLLMFFLRDEICDYFVEEMLFICWVVIVFLLVVVCFGVLIVNFYYL